ncbi:DUF2786 domain-containing protein [Rhodococcus sp. X156]|uniref:DUF2786 domain-containing protein n=1 Tax=Rhodococcus sp. X156 TaxID=2499145 RepID=UPI000FDAA13E|nr:DUF2786 domain-containing protein [Rhodococcus sp. X156]
MTHDDRLLSRVRAMLAQAEHPNTGPQEAEAFTARALELIGKYGIDQALLTAADWGRERVESRTIGLAAPYARQKGMLLTVVASALGGRAGFRKAQRGREASAVVYAMTADMERIELLYTSLLLQSAREMARLQVPAEENPIPYRRAWLTGYASTVLTRLVQAEKTSREDAKSGGATGVELVLADRSALVEHAMNEAHPQRETTRQPRLSAAGLKAGRRAGARANLGGHAVLDDSRSTPSAR